MLKTDHDGKEKRFVYIDAVCEIADGDPIPVNANEQLKWVALTDLASYDVNPPTKTLLNRLGYQTS